jgi:hypothetical protein
MTVALLSACLPLASADPVLERRVATLGEQVSRQEVVMVAVQDAARQADAQDAAAVQARLAEQEVRVAAMLREAKIALAEAAALNAYAQKQMRLAKESLGRGLTLVDEAKSMRAAADQAVAQAKAGEAQAREEAETIRQEAEAMLAEAGVEDSDRVLADPATGPAVVYGGFHTCATPPMPRDPWAPHRHLGPNRVLRSGIASDLPDSLHAMPVKPPSNPPPAKQPVLKGPVRVTRTQTGSDLPSPMRAVPVKR